MRRLFHWLVPALILALAACASRPPEPTDELAVARSAIEYAVDAGARDSAQAELDRARNLLSQAERANEQGEYKLARQLALQAEAQARLADLKARTTRSRRQVNELENSVEALREEIANEQGGS